MFDDFLEWYEEKTRRQLGSPLRPTTLAAKQYRLRSCARIVGANSEQALAICLGDRESVVSLVDKLHAHVSPGTVRAVLIALNGFGAYAVAKGWIDKCHIHPEDSPRRLKSKPIEVYSQEEIDLLLLVTRARGNLRFWMFLATLAETGRRVREVNDLTWDALKLDADPPHFDLKLTKNARQQYVPLTTKLREEVWTPENILKLKTKGHALWGRDIAEYPFPWQYSAANDPPESQRLGKSCRRSSRAVRHPDRHLRRTTRQRHRTGLGSRPLCAPACSSRCCTHQRGCARCLIRAILRGSLSGSTHENRREQCGRHDRGPTPPTTIPRATWHARSASRPWCTRETSRETRVGDGSCSSRSARAAGSTSSSTTHCSAGRACCAT